MSPIEVRQVFRNERPWKREGGKSSERERGVVNSRLAESDNGKNKKKEKNSPSNDLPKQHKQQCEREQWNHTGKSQT